MKVFVPNAEVVFPGLSWVGPYRTPQYTYAEAFDIDRFGRLFVTEAAKGQVRVLDDVGNELAVLKNQNDDFNIGWPMRIASNRDGFGFWDGVNTRIVLANLEFAESKTVSLK